MGVLSDQLALNLALTVVVIGIVLIFILLVAFPFIPSAVEAQSPPLAISKSASPDPVVAGEELTYIITITNTGPVPLAGVVVTDVSPLHTTFVMVNSQGSDWWMQAPRVGDRREIVWTHNGPLAPGLVSYLRFVVRTETGDAEPIVSQGCRVMAEGWEAMVGQAVTTQVLLPTPAPTLTPMLVPPTATPLPTLAPPTATPTSTPGPTLAPPTPGPSPTLPALQKENAAQASSFRFPFGWAGLLAGPIVIVAVLIPFLMWLVKKKGAIR
jgi:uncharacterized repeat protein (TIGR01451 family)